MMDYTHLFRSEMPIEGRWDREWDLFLSSFNSTSRVLEVFSRVKATQKIWVVHNEYQYTAEELPDGRFTCSSEDEGEFILKLFEEIIEPKGVRCRICIDITGFMRPHMMFLIKLLFHRGYAHIDVMYSEPDYYVNRKKTMFSTGFVHSVREVVGFSGGVNIDKRNDILIVGAGYEDQLIKEVADDKEMSRKIVIFGFPSLRADMYQQNAIRAQLASDSIGDLGLAKHFAPANDPFVTATVLSSIVSQENLISPITNLYLSPVATKAQALGFALFYICEKLDTDTSIIFPFNKIYAKGSSDGIAKIWLYELEFPVFVP